MSEKIKAALRTTACIAFRDIDALPEHEREAVLISLIELLPDAEGEVAQQMLYHMRAERKAQLTLKSILEGVK